MCLADTPIGTINPDAEYKKMTEESVTKLVVSLSLPTVMSQMITSIYNMADTFFVTRLGDSAIGAVSIVYALQFLGVNPYIQYIIRGLIIILAVSIDVRKYIVKK